MFAAHKASKRICLRLISVQVPLKHKVFDNLDFLRKNLDNILGQFSQKTIASVTGYDFILNALSVAGL